MRRKADPAEFERANRRCARIVLAAIEQYGGEESLAVQWARLVLKQPFAPKHTVGQQELAFAETE